MAYIKMQDVIDGLVSHNKRVFGINDAAMIMGKPRNYVSKLLSGNSGVGRIERTFRSGFSVRAMMTRLL